VVPSFPDRGIRLISCSPDHHDVPDGRTLLNRLIRKTLEGKDLTPAIRAVGRDYRHGLGIVDPVSQRLRGEAPEHDRVNGPDAGTGEHRDGGLGDHRQIDGYTVTPFDPESFECIGAAPDLTCEVPVGEHPPVSRFSLPDDGRLVPPRPVEVPVEAVGRSIELAVHEPTGVRQLPVEDLLPG
jgi:hypothetical protein